MDLAWITDPAALVALATLVVMEVVLGIDNLVFISILTNKLPEERRGAARRLGLGLALLLRLALLGTIALIVRLTEPLFSLMDHPFSWRDLILIAGGLFLVYKATTEIHHHVEPADRRRGRRHEPAAAKVRRRDRADPRPRHRLLARQHHHRGRHDRPDPHHGHGRDSSPFC